MANKGMHPTSDSFDKEFAKLLRSGPQNTNKNMCAITGANVARVPLAGTQDHFSTPGASEQFHLPWIADRFAGKPAAAGCAGN